MPQIRIRDDRFGNSEKVIVHATRYLEPANIALTAECEDGEPWACYTVNTEKLLPEGQVAIKTWSEGLGADRVLYKAGIIEAEPIDFIPSGFVQIPIYRLTEFAKKDFGL